ncbi:MAG TPA: type IX secretion system membrane protein PorP/SprF [Cytophagales bacterium]|nr:type IX secretion system membrane protein PorP/SprF [Cytophagales bacterium]
MSCVYSAVAQSNNYVPDSYNNFSKNIALFNPSYISETGIYEFTLSHKFLAGEFSDISYSNFIASKNFRNESNQMSLRLLVGKEQEGPYITIPKAALSYAYQVRLNSDTKLCAGVTLGGTGLYLSAPTVNGSFILPDGVLGLGIKYRKTYIGMSSLQIFNASRTSFRLNRYYNGVLSTDLPINQNWMLKNLLYWNILPEQSIDEFKYSLVADYSNKVAFGVVLRNKAGLTGLASLTIPMHTDELQISFAYNTNYTRRTYYYIPNSMELVVGIVLH